LNKYYIETPLEHSGRIAQVSVSTPGFNLRVISFV